MTEQEPTNVELDEIEESQVDLDEVEYDFKDAILYIGTGDILVSRVISNVEEANGNLVLYEPCQLVVDEFGTASLVKWVQLSDDAYIMLPAERVVTQATPKTEVLKAYHSVVGVMDDAFIPEGTTIH